MTMEKVKAVLQYSAVECGACSLGAILRHYGWYESIPSLRVLLGVSRDGSNAKDIILGARSFGLEAKGMKIPTSKFVDSMLPCIIFWEFRHFLVLEGFENGRAYLSDPAFGRRSVTLDEFNKSYTGIAITLKPGKDFKKGGSKDPSLYERISSIPRAYKTATLLILIVSVVGVLPQLFIAAATSQFLNTFLGDQKAYMGIPIIIVTLVAIIIALGSALSAQLLMRRLQYIISKKLSIELFKKLFESSFGYLAQRPGTELSTRMTTGIIYSQSVIGTFYSYFSQLIQAAVVSIFMLFISWQLTLMVLSIITINILTTNHLVNSRSDDNKKLAILEGKAMGKGYLSILDIETIKATGIEPSTLDGWLDDYVPVIDQRQSLGESLTTISVLSSSSNLLISLATLAYGAYLILLGEFTLGGLLAFQFLSSTIQAPISAISTVGKSLQNIDGLIGRMSDLDSADKSSSAALLDPADQKDNQLQFQSVKESTFNPSVQLENIDYKFGHNLPLFFSDLSCIFKENTRTAIVGPSGSGKSTLIKIISGLIETSNGSVKLDNHPLVSINPETRCSLMSYVPQEIFLFETSIKNNITLWDPDVSSKDISSACKDAEIEEKILTFPMSYETPVSPNSAILSGGQKQRLTIARALSRNPKILLLDEATSALDAETEKKVIQNIYQRQLTTISVSHRMYTSLTSDQVIVLDKGKIVEYGPPKQLIEDNGIFSQLVSDEQTN